MKYKYVIIAAVLISSLTKGPTAPRRGLVDVNCILDAVPLAGIPRVVVGVDPFPAPH